jgi:hypothetical protein
MVAGVSDKSAMSRFERCLQRSQGGEAQGWAEYCSQQRGSSKYDGDTESSEFPAAIAVLAVYSPLSL